MDVISGYHKQIIIFINRLYTESHKDRHAPGYTTLMTVYAKYAYSLEESRVGFWKHNPCR